MSDNSFEQEVLAPDFPLDGVHLVAASAGTGKTYNLQNIYARLIQERGLRVGQIQVMTYTEAATSELRGRLRRVLKDLQALHQGHPELVAERDLPRAQALMDCLPDDAARNRAALAVSLALVEFDDAAISTIHGFCRRALARYSFETGLGFQLELGGDSSATLEQLANDWWRLHRDEAEIDRGKLLNCVQRLAGKTDWKLAEPTPPELAVAAELVREYEAGRRQRQELSFDDLLRALREALAGPAGERLAAQLRQDFRAALIDEFQDTDPVQYDIFRRVFLAAGDHLPVFFVGDPKQAIYSFRGGDIFTYRQAARAVPEERHHRLVVNHRSSDRLVEAVNLVFQDGQDAAGNPQYTFGDAQIACPAVTTPADPGQKKPPLLDAAGLPDDKPFRVVTVPGGGKVEPVLAQLVVETLESGIRIQDSEGNCRPLVPRDVAVLVDSRYTAADVQAALRQRGIPSALRRSGHVFTDKSPTYGGKRPPAFLTGALYAALEAMADPSVRLVRGALVTPFVGLTPQELAELGDDETAVWVAAFRSLQQLWRTSGLGAALGGLERLGNRNGGSLRQRLAARPDGERLLTDYGQLVELCFNAVQQVGAAPEALLNWLDERVARTSEEEESDEYARELESDRETVQIITMHASKGLQFPVVFLPSCCFREPSGVVSYHEDDTSEHPGQLVFDGEKTPASSAEARQEALRLIYVAMTRASHRTVVIHPADGGEKYALLNQLLERARENSAALGDQSPIRWQELAAPTPEDDASLSALAVPAPAVLEPPAAITRRFAGERLKGSYTSLSPMGRRTGPWESGRDYDEGDAYRQPELPGQPPVLQIRGGATIGRCWHEMLEKVDFSADGAGIRAAAANALAAYGFDPAAPAGRGCDVSYLEVTSAMAEAVLGHPFQSPVGTGFTLRQVGWEDRLSEVEFDFSSASAAATTATLAGILRRHWGEDPGRAEFLQAIRNWDAEIPRGYLNGFIDLVFRQDGYYYVVDWKSNSLGGKEEAFTAEGLRREMAEHGYFFQYLLYGVVLHRHLQNTLGPSYRWERHFGGVRYCFLRGFLLPGAAAVFADRPPEDMLEELADAMGLKA